MVNPAFGVIITVVLEPLFTVWVAGETVPFAPAIALTTKVTGGMAAKTALTVQLPVIAVVVYVLPTSVPPQPVTLEMVKPVLGVTVSVALEPLITLCETGVTVPFAPATADTV